MSTSSCRPMFMVCIKENNLKLPESQLFNVILKAKNKREVNNIIEQFTNNMSKKMKDSLNIEVKKE